MNDSASLSCIDWIGTLSFTISMSFSPFSVRLIRSIKSRRNYAMVTVIGKYST